MRLITINHIKDRKKLQIEWTNGFDRQPLAERLRLIDQMIRALAEARGEQQSS